MLIFTRLMMIYKLQKVLLKLTPPHIYTAHAYIVHSLNFHITIAQWSHRLVLFLELYQVHRTRPSDYQSPSLSEGVDQSESTLDKYSWFPDSNLWASLCGSTASYLDFSQRQTTFSYEWKVKKSVELKLGSILHSDHRRKQKSRGERESERVCARRHDHVYNTRESKQPRLRKERVHGIWATESANVAFVYDPRTLFNALFTLVRTPAARQRLQPGSVLPQIPALSIRQLGR